MAKKKKGIFNKQYGTWDVALIKWSVAAWVLFLVTVWSGFRDAVVSVHWAVWLVIAVVLIIKPMKKQWFS